MTIAIMGALPEEVDAIVKEMEKAKTISLAGRDFHCGDFHGQDCVVVFSHIGKVAAALTATLLIDHFTADQIIFTGVAGALNPKLNVGDIVIATSLYQHDMNASPLWPEHTIPFKAESDFYPKKQDIAVAEQAINKFLTHGVDRTLKKALTKFNITAPKVVSGTIATGDQFVMEAQAKFIMQKRSDTLACEMEGAAVAHICDEFNVPCLVIRTISDNANHTAHIDFVVFTNHIAKAYSLGILKEWVLAREKQCI